MIIVVTGTYISEPFTDKGSGQETIYLTLTGHGSSDVEGRAYIIYLIR